MDRKQLTLRVGSDRLLPLLAAALLASVAGVAGLAAAPQPTSPPSTTPESAKIPLQHLEARIALHPDPLLAQVLAQHAILQPSEPNGRGVRVQRAIRALPKT